MELKPKSFTRLGNKVNESKKPRPLKMVMNSVSDKAVFMKNLILLKNADEELRRISITHDLTMYERKRNARMVRGARAKASKNELAMKTKKRKISSLPSTAPITHENTNEQKKRANRRLQKENERAPYRGP